eukprot:g33029.t1
MPESQNHADPSALPCSLLMTPGSSARHSLLDIHQLINGQVQRLIASTGPSSSPSIRDLSHFSLRWLCHPKSIPDSLPTEAGQEKGLDAASSELMACE